MTETPNTEASNETPQQKRSVRKAVEQKQQEPPSFTVVKYHQRKIAEVLPDHIEAKQFLGSAFGALNRDAALMTAANNSPQAFMDSLMLCASLGHVPGGKEFYLTRRKSKHHDGKEIIVGLEGYRGVIERMYRSGAVASVIVREVCKGDRFRFIEGEDDKPVHEVDWFAPDAPDRSSPESIIGVYAYAHLTTGAVSRVVVLSRKDIEKAKQDSDAGRVNKGPWVDHYRAMVLKTAAHRLEPWVPTSAEYRREQLRAAAAASTVPRGVDPETGEIDGDVVDAEVVE